MLIRVYLKSVDSCIHLLASSVVEAAATRSASLITVVEFSVFSNNCGSALSISPMYAWNLYFPFFEGTIFSCKCWWLHFVPVHVDQPLCCCTFCLLFSIYCAWCCHCCFLLFSSRCVLLYVRVRSGIACSSPGLSNQDCLLRYHLKVNSTCTRCIVCHSAPFVLSGQLSQSGLTQGPCRMYCVHVLYTTGITSIVYTLVS